MNWRPIAKWVGSRLWLICVGAALGLAAAGPGNAYFVFEAIEKWMAWRAE